MSAVVRIAHCTLCFVPDRKQSELWSRSMHGTSNIADHHSCVLSTSSIGSVALCAGQALLTARAAC